MVSETQALTLKLLFERKGWTVSRTAGAQAALPVRRDPPKLAAAGGEPEVLSPIVQSLLENTQRRSGRRKNDFHGARLLAIDDSPTHLEYLTEQLRLEGYQVDRAANGTEGLGLLASGTFDCVLVDLLMPEMDGIEVCRRIGLLREQRDSPVGIIMLTGQEGSVEMARGLEAGADDFVVKSADLAILRARIQALLRRNSFQQENRRIREELKAHEREALQASAERHAAQARAALTGQLEEANRELQDANSKLKETQSHLIQREKMASLGQLVAGIAHEINNPLAFVLNNLFLTESTLERILPALDAQRRETDAHRPDATLQELRKVQTRLEHMRKGLNRVKDLVRNLRTFSRFDAGGFQTVDIHEGIDSALLFLHHRMQGRIELEKRYGLGRRLGCYAGQLNQVLLNLLANATDSIEGAGKIVIATGESGGWAFISIRDSGPGIPEDVRDRIFEPFFTTKPVGRGTGLGLAISYGIVHAHNGTIEALSGPGGGAEFIVKIPLNLEKPPT